MLEREPDDALFSAESAGVTDDALFSAESAGVTDDALFPAESADATVERPDQRRAPDTRRILTVIAAAAALAVALVLGLIRFFPTGAANTPTAAGGPSGSDQFGSAPRTAGTATAAAGDRSGSPAAGPSPTGTPSVGLSGGPGPVAGVDLRATYQVSKGLTNTAVSVRITNEGTAAADGWSVVMKVSGVPLSVKPGPGVTYHGAGGELTFTPPASSATMAPGDVVAFTFTVTGVLGKVQSCTITGGVCTGA